MQPDWNNILSAAGLLLLLFCSGRLIRLADQLNPLLLIELNPPQAEIIQLVVLAAIILLILLAAKYILRK